MNLENKAVIKALNMYGRVPEMWELLKEIERLNNIINEIEKDLEDRYYGRGKYNLSTDIVGIPTFLNRIKEIKGSEILL